MSRSFDGTNDYLSTLTIPDGSEPYSIAFWFKAATSATFRVMASVGNGLSTERIFCALNSTGGSPANTPSALITGMAPAETTLAAAATYTASAWQHYLFVRNANNDHRIYLNGANKATETSTTVAISTLDRFYIGARDDLGGNWFNGLIAYAAYWNIALSDANAVSLQTTTPNNVASPIAYWPLTSNSSPEPDDVGSNDLTVNGGASFSTDNPTFGTANLLVGKLGRPFRGKLG